MRAADISEIVMVGSEADYRKYQDGVETPMHKIHGLAVPTGGLAAIETEKAKKSGETKTEKKRDFVFVFVEVSMKG